MFSHKLQELERQHADALANATEILSKAASENRPVTAQENDLIAAHTAMAGRVESGIRQFKANNTLHARIESEGYGFLVDAGRENANPEPERTFGFTQEHPKAVALKRNFNAWLTRAAGNVTGLQPTMEATNPSGVISVGSGAGLDSVNFAVPNQVLPFLKSYIQFAPFERAGASLISTDHMRPVNLPIVAAGAPPTAYAEGAGPASGASGSQPFGLSGFTFGAQKYSRQVIASWESLQSTEAPLAPMISDELLTSVANALTAAATTALFNALTAPLGVTIASGSPAPLQIGGSGTSATIQADTYGQVTALRHALPDGLEAPTNGFMLSRSSLSVIRNTRASTSGVPMFDPDSDTILGRPYFVNESFDSVCGGGFIVYGNWNRGAYLRRTPVITRILQELYWLNSEIGFLATQWGDNHFLAELVGASQPPTFQPLYFTVLPSGSLQ